jgi:signal transduction histidine kinase
MSASPPETGLEPPDSGGGYRAEALVSLVRLRWFVHLRCVMLLFLFVVLATERYWIGPHRPAGLWWVLLALSGVNVFWWVLSRSLERRIERDGESDVGDIRIATLFANVQILVDLLLLTAIIGYTGGVENPMAIFYLFHMAIASLLLTRRQAFLQGIWAFLLYVGLAAGQLGRWLPHYPFVATMPSPRLFIATEYVALVVVVVGCGIFGTLFFTQWIAARLDERERVLRSVNRALRQSQIAIRELQRRRAQFMRTAAHQLKSPLAIIQTQINMLRDGIVPEANRKQIYDKVITRCHVAIGQVTDLLTFARVQDADAGRRVGAVANLARVVREVSDRYRPMVESKKLDYECDVPTNGDWTVQVEPTDLSDAIGNLLDNAVKYTEPPGKVSVKLARAGDSVAVSVEDTGMGMALDTQQDMFDAYRRGNRALEKGIYGSGLGLSIVRAVAEQAGGEVVVRSRPDEGSKFTIVLPAGERTSDVAGIRAAGTSSIRIE